MSRIGAGNVVTLPPTNNIYTVLTAVAVVAQILGLIVLFVGANDVGGLI